MKVSHEVPISLLEKSREFNDYDYALVHLFESRPEYYQFFVDSLAMGREVMLDNSIFELGEAFDSDRYAFWIDKLKPTYFILPDALENQVKTLEKGLDFIKKYPHLMSRDSVSQPIGVVQGKSLYEIEECYKFWDKEIGIDYIAISFDYSLYESLFSSKDKFRAWMLGRKHIISCLESSGTINKKKKHHLLGCSLPQEFSLYVNEPWVSSVDTSNPIVHGIKGIKYTSTGLESKESIKLAELIDHQVSEEEESNIGFNVLKFKQFASGK